MTSVSDLGRDWAARRKKVVPNEFNVIFVSSLPSTQALARTLVEQCVHEYEGPLPFVIAALEQTRGKGRRDRVWSSPKEGGFYGSLVLPVAGPERLQELPVRIAVALAELVNERIGDRCRVKWPNDLVVGRKKLGGILVDVVTPPAPAEIWAILGMGVNLRTPPVGDRTPVTSITEAAAVRDSPRFNLAELVGDAIVAIWSALHSERQDWIERFVRLSVHRPGDPLRFLAGDEEIAGRFSGFDENGFLLLDEDSSGALRTVRSGEVFAW